MLASSTDAPPARTRIVVHALSAAFSVALHATLAGLFLLVAATTFELDSPGEGTDNDGPVGNGGGQVAAELATPAAPVHVSVYVPPTPGRTPRPKSPPAEPSPEAAPDAPTAAEGATDGSPDGQAVESPDATGDATKQGVAGRPPRGKRKPCEPIDEVVKLGPQKWSVERGVVDWYATHLRELEKQAGVGPHTGPDGKRDGARLYLPRCSVLKQGGLRSGDVIHTVNGHPVTTVAQAVKVYLLVRGSRKIDIELTRKNGNRVTFRYKLI